MAKTIIIGVGNLLFTDEGVGLYAALFLSKNYTITPKSQEDELEIMDGGTLGFRLMSYFQEYDNVIILDTVSIEDKPGSIYRLPHDVLMGLGTYRKTAHEVEILEMLEICSLLENIANVVIMGIVPQDIETVEMTLTAQLKEAFDGYIDAVLKEMRQLGFEVEPKEKRVELDTILQNFYKECEI